MDVFVLPRVIVMIDSLRMPDPIRVARRLAAGTALMVRHNDPRERRALAGRLAPICRARGLLLIISDDLDLAHEIGAFGLHLPERSAWSVDALTLRRKWSGLLTSAAHSPRALRRAATIGADAALVSPVFSTASHPGGATLGVFRFAAWIARGDLPVYALGGVTPDNARRLRFRKVAGFAGIGSFL